MKSQFDAEELEIRKKRKRNTTRAKHQRDYTRPFIAWDGEGIAVAEPTEWPFPWGKAFTWPESDQLFFDHQRLPQPYVLLANSVGDSIERREGLGTIECLEMILEAKVRNPDSIFVGFGFNYDINQMLKDLEMHHLQALHSKNVVKFQQYKIKWLPGKSFYIRHGQTGRSATIYDTFSFFQKSFLATCKDYLGEDDPDLEIINRGKRARKDFKWEELEQFIKPYNQMELNMLVRVMNLLRADLNKVNIYPSEWHGPGAVANKVMATYNIPIARNVPKEVLDAAQFAYAGGRFEQYYLGYYPHSVWEYDNNSAYPAAALELPNLQCGTWEHVKQYEPDTFGVWLVDYQSSRPLSSRRPEPLFCRDKYGGVSYPHKVVGWYWTPEAEFVSDSVCEGWVFREDDPSDRPFAFIQELYQQRLHFKEQKNPLERAIKLILNSLYGKMAQTVGYNDGPPAWHQLEYAGYITSRCRAKMYEAIELNPEAIIAVETDAVFSTVPLPLPLTDELGDWKDKEYKSICFIQSGVYYATKDSGEVICKYRGMDADPETKQPVGLSYWDVLAHLRDYTGLLHETKTLRTTLTRFIGLGIAMQSNSIWRSWEVAGRYVYLDHQRRSSKRLHINSECPHCQAGISMYREMHPLTINDKESRSYARALPWRHIELEAEENRLELAEEDPTFHVSGEDLDRWQ